jgi:hypothetical protein
MVVTFTLLIQAAVGFFISRMLLTQNMTRLRIWLHGSFLVSLIICSVLQFFIAYINQPDPDIKTTLVPYLFGQVIIIAYLIYQYKQLKE